MAEIDRINNVLAAFFRLYPSAQRMLKQHAALKQAILACWGATDRRIAEHGLDGEDIKRRHQETARLVEQFERTDEPTELLARVVIKSVMTTRRATYPLNGPTPWESPTPEQALEDDDDAYSFAIFDTVAEEIQKQLPTLFQLAAEGT